MYNYLKILFTVIVFAGSSFPQDLLVNQPRIAVLFSGLTEKLDSAKSSRVTDVITAWELFLMQYKIPYKVVYDEDMESGMSDDIDILILPSVNFISADQMEELQKFLANGNSIISSGSKLQFETGSPKNFNNLKTLFKLSSIESVSLDDISYLHSIIPNYINQFCLDDNFVLQISSKNLVLESNSFESNVNPYGYSFYKGNLSVPRSSILYGMLDNGKYLWLGFDILDVLGGDESLLAFKKIITNSINWMDNKPDVYIENFTHSLSSPLITSIQYNNALRPELIDVLHDDNSKPILLASPDQIIANEFLQKFNNNELVLDFSAINNLTADYLIEMINQFNINHGTEINSILVEKKFLETVDLSFISNNGIEIVLYVTQAFGLPKIMANNILAIPFSKNVLSERSKYNVNFLYYKPKFNCSTNQEEKLIEELNQLKTDNYNFSSFILVQEWWNIRTRITSEMKLISDNEIELLINNKNLIKINGLKIYLNIPNRIDKNSLNISLNGTMLNFHLDNKMNIIEINLDGIRSNSTSKIKLSFSTK